MSFTLLSFAFLTQETGPYDISQYPHPLGKAADGTEVRTYVPPILGHLQPFLSNMHKTVKINSIRMH